MRAADSTGHNTVAWPQAARVLCASLAVVAGLGCGDDARVDMVHAPRFTSFSYKHPDKRTGYPASAVWGSAAPDQTSGFDYMMRFTPGDVDTDYQLVQTVVVFGWRWHSRDDCGDKPVRVPGHIFEYFHTPANDVQSRFSEPVPVHSGHVEGRFSETRAGNLRYFKLPGRPPAIANEQNAAELDAAYLKSLTDDQQADLVDNLDEATILRWEHQKQYDGCKAPDGSNHILNHSWWPVDDGTAGARTRNRYAGSGNQW